MFLAGLSALPNTVAVVLLLETEDLPSYFGMMWTGIAMAGLLASGLQLPVAGMYFDNLSCCGRRRRKALWGDIDWEDAIYQEELVVVKRQADSQRRNIPRSSELSLIRADVQAVYQVPCGDSPFHAR